MPRSSSTAVQSERTRGRSPRALTSPARWIPPPNSSNFSVNVVLPGCEMMAKVRRRAGVHAVAGKRSDYAGTFDGCDGYAALCQDAEPIPGGASSSGVY